MVNDLNIEYDDYRYRYGKSKNEGFIIPPEFEIANLATELGVKGDSLTTTFNSIRDAIDHNDIENYRHYDSSKYAKYIESQLETSSPIEAVKEGILMYKAIEQEKKDNGEGEETDEEGEEDRDQYDDKDYATDRIKNNDNKDNKSDIEWVYKEYLNYHKMQEFKSLLKSVEALDKQDTSTKQEHPEGTYVTIRAPKDEDELLSIYLNSTEDKVTKMIDLIDGEGLVEIPVNKQWNPLTIILPVDDSGSMTRHREKLIASLEFFIEKHAKRFINLIILPFEVDIKEVIQCSKLETNNPKTPLMQQVKAIYKAPNGGGTNLANVIEQWNRVEHKYLTPEQSANKEIIIVNDGADSMCGEFPTKTHAIAFEFNQEIKTKCENSGGTYSVF